MNNNQGEKKKKKQAKQQQQSNSTGDSGLHHVDPSDQQRQPTSEQKEATPSAAPSRHSRPVRGRRRPRLCWCWQRSRTRSKEERGAATTAAADSVVGVVVGVVVQEAISLSLAHACLSVMFGNWMY